MAYSPGYKAPSIVTQRDRYPGPPCRTLADMTEEEIVAIEREYGCPVIRPGTALARKKKSPRTPRFVTPPTISQPLYD